MICEVFGFDRSLAGWLIVLFREYTEPALNNLKPSRCGTHRIAGPPSLKVLISGEVDFSGIKKYWLRSSGESCGGKNVVC